MSRRPGWSDWNSRKFSCENVEKVVSPPQNPAVTKALASAESDMVPLSISPYIRPIMKQPIILTVSVAHGKSATRLPLPVIRLM